MTMEDLKALEKAHEKAAQNVQAIAVNIVERVLYGKDPTEAQIAAYTSAKKKAIAIKADIVRAMNEEFEDLLNG